VVDLEPRGRRPLVIAHAACKGHAPENTLGGIRAAITLGSDAAEIDVRCTADGVPVLLHDPALDRTTDGSGRLADTTFEQVRKLRADRGLLAEGRRAEGFAAEHIPTLREALDVAGSKAVLVLEIKEHGIEAAVVDVVLQAEARDRVMAWSFLPDVVARMRAVAPWMPCSLLWEGEGRDGRIVEDALELGAVAISPHHSLVRDDVVRRALLHGLAVYPWTADEAPDIGRLAALGVDGICSNFPERVRCLT
jgi:glycerophosphoryl diester phosphodiesterase